MSSDVTGAAHSRSKIGLTAAIVAIEADEPLILIASGDGGEARPGLPFGAFNPLTHRTFDIGLRVWVEEQTGLSLGYVEQLYTFGDRGRHARPDDPAHMVSIGYLALTRVGDNASALRVPGASFEPWYRFFPWEDWREAQACDHRDDDPACADGLGRVRPRSQIPPARLSRRDRVRLFFGTTTRLGRGARARPLRTALRSRTGRRSAARRPLRRAGAQRQACVLGVAMRFDHRRILATAIARLRAKLKYRPVVFELLPPEFTLTELQRTVEAISGRHLHKQNFRRLVEAGALVEPTGDDVDTTGGRPAALFRFRREVLQERPAPGLRVRRPTLN